MVRSVNVFACGFFFVLFGGVVALVYGASRIFGVEALADPSRWVSFLLCMAGAVMMLAATPFVLRTIGRQL